MRVVMYSDMDPVMKGLVGCQVVQQFKDNKIYKSNIIEKHKTIRNKSQDCINVPEKPEKSNPEIVDGQDNHCTTKEICDTIYTEYVQLRKPAKGKAGKEMAELTNATGKREQHDEAICGGYKDYRDELRVVPKGLVRETEHEVPEKARLENDEPMSPADTEVIPALRDYESVPYFGGK